MQQGQHVILLTSTSINICLSCMKLSTVCLHGYKTFKDLEVVSAGTCPSERSAAFVPGGARTPY